MAISNLKDNIETEKEIVREIYVFLSQLKNIERFYPYQRRNEEVLVLKKALSSLVSQLKIINESNALIIQSASPFQVLVKTENKAEEIVSQVIRTTTAGGKAVTIKSSDKRRFMNELDISDEVLKRIKRKKKKEITEESSEFKKSGIIARVSNKFFFNLSASLIQKGHSKKLELNLRKANLPSLLVTYLSTMFFFTLLALLAAIVFFTSTFFFSYSAESPYIVPLETIVPKEIVINLVISAIAPLLVFFAFYFYPYAERKSISKGIERELPFVTLHMSAVAGSGIEPTQVFKIIAFSREYKHIRKEMIKLVNQINLYGYDLVSALRNIARETSSKKLAELLNGMATTISGGGSLQEFLNKRAETLLFDYRLEKEKETKSAETFMDIYISIVVAAPMILSLLLVLMNISSINIGISLEALSFVIVGIVSLINLVFLVMLQMRETGG